MRLKITHETGYRYDHPAQALVQSLRLTPSVHEGQRVTDWQIAVSRGQRGAAFRDGAGDWIEARSRRSPSRSRAWSRPATPPACCAAIARRSIRWSICARPP